MSTSCPAANARRSPSPTPPPSPTTRSVEMAASGLIARHHGVARIVERYGIIGVVLAMAVLLYVLQPEFFLSIQNVTNVLKQIAMNALLAMGMFLVILTA